MSAGELVTEMFDFDGGREVTVYVPNDPPNAIVYAGDGQLIAPWGADVPATMVVGVHRREDEWARIHEYSPGFEPETFGAHEQFVLGEVRAWVHSRFDVALPPQRTAVCGVSASGELALALGMRHPDIFGAVFCASPGGGYQPEGDVSGGIARAYFTGGTDESWFFENAKRWADALSAVGAEVVIEERPGNHGDPFWREEFARQCAWAFPTTSPLTF